MNYEEHDLRCFQIVVFDLSMTVIFPWPCFPFGAIQKVCHRPRGEGSSKIVTNSDKGGKGGQAKQ